MIQSFQKFSQSRIAKAFLAIVALSFILFFGGGNWFRPHDRQSVVAEVGGLTISRYEFATQFQRQAQRIIAESGDKISREQLIEGGLPQMVLSQMTQDILLDLEATHLGLAVSDEAVRNRIQSIKAFQDEKGSFDRELFVQVLRSNNILEDTFISEVRQDLVREQLVNAIKVGAYVPEEMVSRLFEAQHQYRKASLLMINPKDIAVPATPSEAVLKAFYEKHKQAFKTPELRTFSVLFLDPNEIGKDIPVSEEEITATYDAKPDIFGEKPLKDVREEVISDVRREKASEEIYTLSQDLEDKIAGGTTFEELGPQTKGAKVLKLEAIDATGHTQRGELSAHLPQNPDLARDLLETAYSLEEGMDSPFSQAKAGVYYTVRLDKIRPSTIEPFESLKDRVLTAWRETEQQKFAKEKAQKYAKDFNQGDRKVALMAQLPKLSLSEPSPTVNDEVKSLVFSLQPGQAGVSQTPEGFAVVALNEIIPATEMDKREKMEGFKNKLLEHYGNDLVQAYVSALRIRYPVSINWSALKTLQGS